MSYTETFKDHFARPRHAGSLPTPTASAERVNPVCGDRLRLFLQVKRGRITDVRFLAYGCPPTIACGSALAEMLLGLSVDVARALKRQDITHALGGLPARKGHASALAIETLEAALALLDSDDTDGGNVG